MRLLKHPAVAFFRFLWYSTSILIKNRNGENDAFQLQVYPQFRDADHDGLIGLRGCMRYFQDCHTHFMCSIEKGNDVIPERYGAAWIYTQYHVSINRKIGYDAPLLLRQWIQPYHRPLLLTLNTTIEQNGEIVACGTPQAIRGCERSLTGKYLE